MNVEGATHRQVVELIKSSDQVLKLTVISIAPEVAEKLENTGMLQFEIWMPTFISKLHKFLETNVNSFFFSCG